MSKPLMKGPLKYYDNLNNGEQCSECSKEAMAIDRDTGEKVCVFCIMLAQVGGK